MVATAKASDDDLLASFLEQVSSQPTVKEPPRDQKSLTPKYAEQDLGTPQEIIDRLLQHNYQWKNLNPYYVLDLDIDATEEDIKQRYRKVTICPPSASAAAKGEESAAYDMLACGRLAMSCSAVGQDPS